MTEPTPPVLPQWTPPPPAYGYPYGYAPQRPTNGMAIAAMIVSIVGVATICGYGVGPVVICPVGAILGHVARKRIRERDEKGDGMALTGIIVGWVGLALGLLATAFFAWFIWYVMSHTPPAPNGY
jgi:drug/metabolite transporter (DMT)-like permease